MSRTLLFTDSTLSTMSYSPTLRFTASSILRLYSVPSTSTRFTLLRPSLPARRFSSATTRRLKPIVAARKREDEDLLEDDAGNGSVGVGLKDKVVREGRVVATELHMEATDAYMSYAMSVFLGRALPDVRDGLKPMHRRILYAMHEVGLASKKPYKKCARVVWVLLSTAPYGL